MLKAEQALTIFANRISAYSVGHLGAIVALLSAIAFVWMIPDHVVRKGFNSADIHLTCAGIIGTALALVLSLSIVPAQKAADDFSPAILRLYARDARLLSIFGVLVVALIISVLFGSEWRFGLNARDTIAAQVFVLGVSLDRVRAFYLRALDLLDPATAFPMVLAECRRVTNRVAKSVERLLRIQEVGSTKPIDKVPARAILFQNSVLPAVLRRWVDQLAEVAHKAVARRDTQSVRDAVTTIAMIGIQYTETRRDSVLVVPDFSALLPVGRADISTVLEAVYEAIRLVAEDAAEKRIEPYFKHCVQTTGSLIEQALSVIADEQGRRSAPLAYAPVFYLDQCVKRATESDMEDALLAAVPACSQVFSRIREDVESRLVESAALDVLIRIAAAGFRKPTSVVARPAVEAILRGAKRELIVRGVEDVGLLSDTLEQLPPLIQGAVVMEKAVGQGGQVFPPYALSFDASIAAILHAGVERIPSVDSDRPWLSPFLDFEELSEMVWRHYHDVAKKVIFGNALLLRWVISSILYSTEIHIRLLEAPPADTEPFLDAIRKRTKWFIHLPTWFFSKERPIPRNYAEYACEGLAYMSLELLRQGEVNLGGEGVEAIGSIASNYLEGSNPEPFGWADIVAPIECIARGADALGFQELAQQARTKLVLPPELSDVERKRYQDAFGNRIGHLDRRLRERERKLVMSERHDPVRVLRTLLNAEK